jgi:hypothetical protein
MCNKQIGVIMKKLIFSFIFLGLSANLVSAQNVINPGHVEYTVSPDHASLSKYTLGFFLAGATDPVQSQDLPIVAPDGTGKVTQPINSVPLAFGTYVARMRSFAGTVGGEWSVPSNAFDRAPLPTPAPVVKK